MPYNEYYIIIAYSIDFKFICIEYTYLHFIYQLFLDNGVRVRVRVRVRARVRVRVRVRVR